MSLSKLIPLGRANDLIGLKKTAIYDLIRAGDLQAVKIGRKTFLEDTEIARFRAANERKIGRQDTSEQAA